MERQQRGDDYQVKLREEWFGYEKEGRLKGVKTFFIGTACSLKHYSDWQKKYSKESTLTWHHVFVCPPAITSFVINELEWFCSYQQQKGGLITVAVYPEDLKLLPPSVFINAHVMVDIKLEGACMLKETDTIKIEVAPYTTFSTSLEQTVKTTPADYTNDRYIEREGSDENE